MPNRLLCTVVIGCVVRKSKKNHTSLVGIIHTATKQREGGRQRQTDRQTEREREVQTDRQTDRVGQREEYSRAEFPRMKQNHAQYREKIY